MIRSFLKRDVLKGKKLSPPVTLNEQPLVLSSPSAHKPTTDFSGNSAQEVRKTGRIKLALNPGHCSKPLPLVQFSNNVYKVDI